MNENEFALAVSRFLENELSPAEEGKLLEAIQADPELRAAFISHVRMSVRLDAAHHDPRDLRLIERTKALMSAKDPGQSLRTLGELQRRVGGRARARRWVAWGLAAASVLIASLVAVKVMPRRSEGKPDVGARPLPRPRPAPRPTPPEEPVPPQPPAPVVPKPEPIVPAPKPPDPAPRSKPDPAPVPEVRPEPPPSKPEPPRVPVETKVAAARIESLTGEAFLSAGRKPLKAGQDLLPGEGVRTGDVGSGAVIVFPDKTRLEVGANTTVAALFDHESPAAGARGKRVTLDRGHLRAHVAPQPAEQPMEVATPHAEAKVLGTTLRLHVGDRKDGATRLEVVEGKVGLKNRLSGTAAEVAAGHYAVAAADLDPVSYANPLVIDLNDFGNARDAKPAEGPVRRLYPDVSLASTGGTCVAAPGVGTSLEGAVALAPGTWFVWIRFRDTDQGPVSFQVGVDGRLVDTIAGEGFLKKQGWDKWNWRRVEFESKAKATRLTLRSTSDALRFDKSKNTYNVVNRWDSILLTRDPRLDPERNP